LELVAVVVLGLTKVLDQETTHTYDVTQTELTTLLVMVQAEAEQTLLEVHQVVTHLMVVLLVVVVAVVTLTGTGLMLVVVLVVTKDTVEITTLVKVTVVAVLLDTCTLPTGEHLAVAV
jgi:hypothetical protein